MKKKILGLTMVLAICILPQIADARGYIVGVKIRDDSITLEDIADTLTLDAAFTLSGNIINLNVSSNYAVNIGTGSSTGAVTIGGGSNTFAVASTGLDVSTAGALTGVTSITMSGDIDISASDSATYDLILKDNVADAWSIRRASTDMIVFTSTTASPLITITPATTITGALTANGGIVVGTVATGISFTGTYTGNVIDFSSSTHVPTGSNGPCLIRAGTYASPITNTSEDQSGLMRLYMSTTADGTSYDRGVFVCLKTEGTKSIFPVSGLAEVLTDATGPTKAQAAQFIVGLHEAGSNLATAGGDATAGMYGAWLKVYSIVGSVAASGSKVAPVWVDNQMSGTVSGEEYGIFATTGGTRPDGFIGFETSSSGYDQFIYADSTFDSGAGTCITTDAVPASNQDARIKVYYNATQYYIPLYR